MDTLSSLSGTDPILLGGAAVLALLVVVLVVRRRGSADRRQSKKAHDAAQQRDPPVEIGETYEFGITDFSEHHSGDENAVGKVEGFVLFVEDIPGGLSKGDVIEAKVLSFNDGRTSADATFVGRR
jgi:predicted RNA-binding protein with TRAM domain